MESLETTFRRLYEYLENEGYAWRALSPERVRKLKGSGEAERQAGRPLPLVLQDPLTSFFALGEGEIPTQLPVELKVQMGALRPAVSRVGGRLVAHDHWDARGELVYLSQETYELLERLPPCAGMRVLDLGSGAGALSLAVSSQAREVVGIEVSARAVEWARASAAAQGVLNVIFCEAAIGTPSAHAAVGTRSFDLVVFNPPMAIPDGAPRPHRDGGTLGCELPSEFLDFAYSRLRPGGEVCFLATSPVLAGRSIFRERISCDRRWSKISSERLNPRFNHSLARKAGYAALRVERVELWFFRLRSQRLE